MPELPVTIAEVRRAAAAVEAAVPRTPTIEAPALSERAGVIAMSAGNHAHGVALHAGYAAAPFWRPSQSWSAVATPRRCLPAGSAAISRPAGSRTRSRSRRSTVWRCAEPSSSLPTGEPPPRHRSRRVRRRASTPRCCQPAPTGRSAPAPEIRPMPGWSAPRCSRRAGCWRRIERHHRPPRQFQRLGARRLSPPAPQTDPELYLDEFVFRFNRRRDRHAAIRPLLGIAALTSAAQSSTSGRTADKDRQSVRDTDVGVGAGGRASPHRPRNQGQDRCDLDPHRNRQRAHRHRCRTRHAARHRRDRRPRARGGMRR
jgi:hypothetical protein